MLEGYMTSLEAAIFLKKSNSLIRKLCNGNKFKGAKKLGNMWVIPYEEIKQYTPGLKGFAEVWRRRREKDKEIITTIKEAATANKL